VIAAETWKPVVGYEGRYEVSSLGRVKSLPRKDIRGRTIRGRMLAQITHPSGHIQVKLSLDGACKQGRVHRIVMLAFAGAQPAGCEVCHNDGNPANNSLTNLRWGTRSENLYDRVRHGTHHMANRTHCPQQHPYSTANTYVTSDGRRMCRECLRIRNAQTRALKLKEKQAWT